MEKSRRSPLLVGSQARGVGNATKLRRLLWRWLKVTEAGVGSAVARSDADLVIMWLTCGARLSDAYLQALPYTNEGGWAPFTEDGDDGDC